MACIWKEFGDINDACQCKFFPLPKHLQKGLYIYLGLSNKLNQNRLNFMYFVADEAQGIYQAPFSIS